MSLQNTIKVTIPQAQSGHATMIIAKALEAAGIRSLDRNGYGVSTNRREPDVATVVAWVVADDPDSLLNRFVDALKANEIEVLDATITSKPVEPYDASAPGVTYDKATGTLTIHTHDPDWNDVTLGLIGGRGDITGIGVTNAHGHGRVEDGFHGLKTIIVRRWGGKPVHL
jgi:hypothetical protein